MPIIRVHSEFPIPADSVLKMAENIRNRGRIPLNTTKDNIWITFEILQRYINSERTPFVIVKAQSGRSQKERTAFLEVIAEEVGRAFSVSEKQVWIQYEEMDPKDVWFGGHWSKESEKL